MTASLHAGTVRRSGRRIFSVQRLQAPTDVQQDGCAVGAAMLNAVSVLPGARQPPPLFSVICSTLTGRYSILWCSTLANSSNSCFVSSMALQYGRGLHRFLSFRLRNVQDVPDLAQEVYLRLLRVDRHEAIRNPEAYLFTIASHVLHQHSLRQAANAAVIEVTEAIPELFAPAGEDPSMRVENSERMERFQKILARLPPRVGVALVMHRIGFTVQEVANELGVARETVKKYLTRAVEHCRNAGYGAGQDE